MQGRALEKARANSLYGALHGVDSQSVFGDYTDALARADRTAHVQPRTARSMRMSRPRPRGAGRPARRRAVRSSALSGDSGDDPESDDVAPDPGFAWRHPWPHDGRRS